MMDASNTLLKRLCSHVTAISDNERLTPHFQIAVSLLNEGWSGAPTSDHNVAADKIKRKLVREKRLEDAARFSGLIDKLLKSTVLRNKASILSFFHALSNDRTPNVDLKLNTSLSSLLRPSLENGSYSGPSSDESFPMPKLYHQAESNTAPRNVHHGGGLGGRIQAAVPKSFNGPRLQDTSSPHVSGSNRVSRLAEMYKGAASANPDSPFAELQHHSPGSERLQSQQLPHSKKPSKEALIEVTEKVLIREVLFIFQGIEGKIIKTDINKDGYRLDPKVRLSMSQKEMILKLTEVGWLYDQVQNFCEWGGSGSDRTAERTVAGLVNQSLILALKEELNEFCRLIAVLEAQIQEGGDTPMGEQTGGLTLRRLMLWTLEPRTRLKVLAFLTHAAREVYGGACLSAIYRHLHHGDPGHKSVVGHVLSKACTPLYVMLTQWLLDGTLEDPHHEFFIASDPTVPDEKLWHDKYSIRSCMLPSFITKSQAQKVLATGKSLNFLRNVCHFRAPIAGRDAVKEALQQTTVESLFTQDESSQLDNLIGLTFRETSRHVLEEILTRHKLMDHLRAHRRYLLLGQGDFIHYLMEILNPELGKPASNLYPHNLSSLLETAVAASNAQYEEPDILKRLDVRLLEINSGDLGWDVFSLDYHVDGPIGTVFTADCMRQYLMLFNALWKDKRMEKILSDIWKEQAATSKMCRDLPEMGVVLHGIQLLRTEMVHMVHQMEYYLTFEVLECSWHSLMSNLKTAQSLDQVIAGHNLFLRRIVAGALLDDDSKEVRTHLRTLYNLIQNLRGLQERVSVAVSAELSERRNVLAEMQRQTNAGEFGITSEQQEAEKKRRKEFTSKVVPKLKSDLKINTQTYEDMVQSFLLMLTQHNDQNLHMLSTRLDFNEYYHRRDDRLNQRMTYHHKRKSMGASFCQ